MAGKIERSITHWTGGGGRAAAEDKAAYHRITEHDGRVVNGKEEIDDNIVTSDGDYAAHTLRMNTGSAGFAMAGMHGAVEMPFDPGQFPINEVQFEAHCAMLAEFHQESAIPITPRTCCTHAEVESLFGVKQNGKWDLTRLVFKPELRGATAVGDYMRARVRAYMGVIRPPALNNRPTLRLGDRGEFVRDAQTILNVLHYFVGREDAIFGSKTHSQVMAFQAANGLDPDGVIGPLTWAALMRAPEAADRDITEDEVRESGSRTIQTADTGEQGAKLAGVGIGGLGALEIVTGAAETAESASGALDILQQTVADNWPILLILIIGGLIYFKGSSLMNSIRRFRVEDARTGANMKR